MKNIIKQLRVVLATFVMAMGAVLVYSALPSTSVHAQAGAGSMMTFKSVGPVQFNPNESALIGLLVPAVRPVDKPFRLQLFDGMGYMIVNIPVEPNGGSSLRGAFYEVLFGDGSLRVLDHTTGKLLATRAHSDGIVSMVLVPAVQKSGRSLGAVSASVQIFDANKQRGQVIVMCDGSV